MQNTKLDCIYYPFSRLLDPTTLKHLLLIFDSVTFLDEAESPQWRRALLEEMRSDSPIFATFEELADDYDMLEESGTVLVRSPHVLASKESRSVAIATIADLTDASYVKLASAPQRFGLPAQLTRGIDLQLPPRPTWQVFQGKLAEHLHADPSFANDARWRSHIIRQGDEVEAWALTYEAGSASVLNYYLEVAEELSLTPVTSSELHHRLVLRKVKRMAEFGSDQNSLESDIRQRCRAVLGQGEILSLFSSLFPRASLKDVSFAEIVRFREETSESRHRFLERINGTLRVIDADVSTASYDREVALAVQDMGNQMRRIQQDLSVARDRLLPSTGEAVMYGTAGSGALGALATFLGGLSPAGLVAASSLAVGLSGALLVQASKAWAARRSTLRSQDSSVTYLLSISGLSGKK
jgi:hypothetical protein